MGKKLSKHRLGTNQFTTFESSQSNAVSGAGGASSGAGEPPSSSGLASQGEVIINRESIRSLALMNGLLYVGDTEGIVNVFDLEQKQQKETLKVHTKAVTRIVDGPGDSYFTASRDKSVSKRMLGITDGAKMEGHRLAVTALAMKPDLAKVMSGSRDGNVIIWDTNTCLLEQQEEIARNIVTDIVWFDSSQAIQCGEDKTVKLWDCRRLHVVDTFPMKQYFQSCCAVNDTQLVTGSVGGNGRGCQVILWDLRERREIVTLNGHEQSLSSVAYFTNRNNQLRIISIADDCYVKVWDPARQECACSLYVPGAQGLTAMIQLSEDSFIIGSIQGALYEVRYKCDPSEQIEITSTM